MRFHAHEGSILASGFTTHKGRPYYITGGNDNTVAVWDVSDCVLTTATGQKSTEGISIFVY